MISVYLLLDLFRRFLFSITTTTAATTAAATIATTNNTCHFLKHQDILFWNFQRVEWHHLLF